jgi:hypothetical protein
MEVTLGNSLRVAVIGNAIYWLLTGAGFLMALTGKSAYGGLGTMLLVATNACAAGFLAMILPMVSRSLPRHWKRSKFATIAWYLWTLLPIPLVIFALGMVVEKILSA